MNDKITKKVGESMVNILVVEDHKDMRDLFCTVLLEKGYRVYQAGNGVEALQILDEVYIELIIADIMMPHMDVY